MLLGRNQRASLLCSCPEFKVVYAAASVGICVSQQRTISSHFYNQDALFVNNQNCNCVPDKEAILPGLPPPPGTAGAHHVMPCDSFWRKGPIVNDIFISIDNPASPVRLIGLTL